MKGDTLQGISVDLLVDILKRAGSNQGRGDIEIVPWARGYRFAQNEERAILFLTSRTPRRETLFKWVGPVAQNRCELIAKKNRQFKFDSRPELLTHAYATVIDDVGEQFLLNLGIQKERLERTSAYASCIKMLPADRVDMVVMSWETFSLFASRDGIDPSDFEIVATLASTDLYYALHKTAPPVDCCQIPGRPGCVKGRRKAGSTERKICPFEELTDS